MALLSSPIIRIDLISVLSGKISKRIMLISSAKVFPLSGLSRKVSASVSATV